MAVLSRNHNLTKNGPLGVHETIARMRMALAMEHGISVYSSNDMREFCRQRCALRGEAASPYFDPSVVGDLRESAFWLWGEARTGEPVYLEAFCQVDVVGEFRDWLTSWLTNIHVRAGEDIALKPPLPNADMRQTVASLLSGRTCYGGEFWVSPDARKGKNGGLAEDLSIFSMLLAAEWYRVDHVFGLSTDKRRLSGLLNRMQFFQFEPDFVRWRRRPACVEEDDENLAVASRETLLRQARKRLALKT